MKRKITALTLLLFLTSVAIVQAVDQKKQAFDHETSKIIKQKEQIKPVQKQKADEIETALSNIGLSIGQKAPNIKAAGFNGDSIDLSTYKGKKVLLNFWATWCPPCKAEIPDLVKFYNKHQSEFVVIGVNIESSKNQVKDFIKQYGITYPIIMDKKETISDKYQIQPIPTTYFIDEDGIIYHKQIGAVTYNELTKMLKK
ncbi:TlpA family protein disulfide reductase [Heyndrickxia camelliae]|nr:TlpA disulfide reductase family protein [Heyndrickxia camelliae]